MRCACKEGQGGGPAGVEGLAGQQRGGERAGVTGVPRFRHTFAINFLRNGLERGEANPWALQTILGHEDIKTVCIYLALAQADTDAAHKASSPVENWRL